MAIKFTQYLLPNGRQKTICITRPAEIEQKADEISVRGLAFEAEILTTGEVSLTVANPAEGEDVAIRVVPNGRQVPEAIDELVKQVWGTYCAPVGETN